MNKVMIIGATGMAGHMLYYNLKQCKKYHLIPVCYRNPISEDSLIIDVRDTEKLIKEIKLNKPSFVINCVGILVKGSQHNQENAIYINAYYPHLLSKIIQEHSPKTQLIHISTDCVFSGKKGLYKVDDEKDALDVYGMSKNLGEINNTNDLTIRTSIIGPELKKNGEGLFHWLMSNRDKKFINGYTKSIWGGITTLELAKQILQVLENKETGIIQLTNGMPISKYDLLMLIAEQFNLSVKIIPVDGVVTDKSFLPSVLQSRSTIPSYRIMIQEMYDFMKEHKSIYNQYLGMKNE